MTQNQHHHYSLCHMHTPQQLVSHNHILYLCKTVMLYFVPMNNEETLKPSGVVHQFSDKIKVFGTSQIKISGIVVGSIFVSGE